MKGPIPQDNDVFTVQHNCENSFAYLTLLHRLTRNPPNPVHRLLRHDKERRMPTIQPLNIHLRALRLRSIRHHLLKRRGDSIILLADEIATRDSLPTRACGGSNQRGETMRLELREPVRLFLFRESVVEDCWIGGADVFTLACVNEVLNIKEIDWSGVRLPRTMTESMVAACSPCRLPSSHTCIRL